MAEGIACSFYPPHKQVQLDVHECYRFQLKNNMEMRLPLFIYPLFVQEEIMTHDYLFKIYKENVCFLSVMRYNQNVGLKWFQCLSEIVVFIWKFCKYFDHYRGIMLDRAIVTWHLAFSYRLMPNSYSVFVVLFFKLGCQFKSLRLSCCILATHKERKCNWGYINPILVSPNTDSNPSAQNCCRTHQTTVLTIHQIQNL